jgi:hypothetical protein
MTLHVLVREVASLSSDIGNKNVSLSIAHRAEYGKATFSVAF